MSEHLALTVSASIDAAMLARRFVEGISRRFDLTPDEATVLKVLASDAATDSTKAGHSIQIRVECDDATVDVSLEGEGLRPPAVVSPPDGLHISGDDRRIDVAVRR